MPMTAQFTLEEEEEEERLERKWYNGNITKISLQ